MEQKRNDKVGIKIIPIIYRYSVLDKKDFNKKKNLSTIPVSR